MVQHPQVASSLFTSLLFSFFPFSFYPPFSSLTVSIIHALIFSYTQFPSLYTLFISSKPSNTLISFNTLTHKLFTHP